MLHSARQRCAMAVQLYASTRLPTGCLCTDRCQRCDRSLRVPTDQSWTQTDRYNRCSECVRAFARAGATGVGTRVHAKPSPGGDGVAGHFAPDLPTHRIAYAATLHSARQRCAMTARLYVSTTLPTGCECTDRCKRWYRSLRVPTDESQTQTDRYHRRRFTRAALSYRLRVHRSVPALRPIVARLNR